MTLFARKHRDCPTCTCSDPLNNAGSAHDRAIADAVKAERERCAKAVQAKIDTLGVVMESMKEVGGYSDAIGLGKVKVVAMQEAIDAIRALAAQEGGDAD